MEAIDIVLVREKLKSVELNCIRQRLSERGVSQKWIAEKMNKTTNTVNGWCCNRVQPHLVDLCVLSVLLRCSLHDLVENIGHDHFSDQEE